MTKFSRCSDPAPPNSTSTVMRRLLFILSTFVTAACAKKAFGGYDDGCGNHKCNGLARNDSETIARRHRMRLPRCCQTDGLSSEWMESATSHNSSLLDYFYPKDPTAAWNKGSLAKVFRPITRGCRVVPAACYCIHVTGSPVKAENPTAWQSDGAAIGIGNNPTLRGRRKGAAGRRLADVDTVASFGVTADRIDKNCSCLAPKRKRDGSVGRCLFSDMRPGKLLAVIGACRRLGITHIIEEGRYGGLSALIYAIHGFTVTSVEMLPIDFVAAALTAAAPNIRQVVGDGSIELPKLVNAAPPSERIAVIFDGEKRRAAYQTYTQIAHKVHLAVFDDSYHERFPTYLDKMNETAWHTNLDTAYATTRGPEQDAAVLQPLESMLTDAANTLRREHPELTKGEFIDARGRLVLPPGGLQDMSQYNFVIVRGGAWKEGDDK